MELTGVGLVYVWICICTKPSSQYWSFPSFIVTYLALAQLGPAAEMPRWMSCASITTDSHVHCALHVAGDGALGMDTHEMYCITRRRRGLVFHYAYRSEEEMI